jgi:hypothetical protein
MMASLGGVSLTTENDALKSFAENPVYAGSDFIVNFDAEPELFSAVYFSPFGRTYTNGYGGLESDELRVMKSSFKPGDIYVAEPDLESLHATTNAERVYQNGVYGIFRLDENSIILYDYAGMSRVPKAAAIGSEYGLLRRVTAGEATFRYMTLKNRSADFSISFYDEDGDAVAGSVFAGGKFLGDFAAPDGSISLELGKIDLAPGINDITVRFDGDVSGLSLRGVRISP